MEKQEGARARWVGSIAAIEEPWVDVVLGEALGDSAYSVKRAAAWGLLRRHYEVSSTKEDWKVIADAEWVWRSYGKVLRHRAVAVGQAGK